MRDTQYFKKQVHWGNGEYSASQAVELHKQLREAINWASGRQQGVEIDSEEYKMATKEIQNLIKSIAIGLGEEISFTEQLQN